MAPIKMERNRFTANKSGMAAVAMFFALAAVPVLADTAQEKVVISLSSETSTGAGHTTQGEATESGAPASSYQEQAIGPLASDNSPGAKSEAPEIAEGLTSWTAGSLEVEHKQREIRTRLHGE